MPDACARCGLLSLHTPQAASSWPRDAQDDALAGLRQQHAAEQEALRAQHAEQEQRLVEQHAQQLRAKNAELHELQEEHAKLHLSLQIMKVCTRGRSGATGRAWFERGAAPALLSHYRLASARPQIFRT